MQAERPGWADTQTGTDRTVRPVAATWLACYPLFHDALRRGQTSFRGLPERAKEVVLKRINLSDGTVLASAIFHDVGASFVEVATPCVQDAVRSYLARQVDRNRAASIETLEHLAAHAPPLYCPPVASPPCVLQPGNGVFLDGWMRFFSYCARGDLTIALVAIDWPDLYQRLDESLNKQSLGSVRPSTGASRLGGTAADRSEMRMRAAQ